MTTKHIENALKGHENYKERKAAYTASEKKWNWL